MNIRDTHTEVIESDVAERRAGGDRRKNSGAVAFPLVDSSGIEVKEDRRKIPDRRINNIVVEEVAIDYPLDDASDMQTSVDIDLDTA